MRITCDYLIYMATMIQIRNVPDELHRKLKSRAALAGQTLSDYLLRQVGDIAARPTQHELLARLRSLPAIDLKSDPVDILREERERR